MDTYKNNPFYTHQPYLIEIIKNTNGNILECGCGDGSTTIIKELIKNSNRKLISLESNLEWLNKYKDINNLQHELYYIDAGNDDNIETGNKWVNFIKDNNFNDFEIIFIDSSPWLSRKCCFDYFLDKAKIIIFHDFDYFPNNNIIGKLIKKTIYYNNNPREKISCNLNEIVKNYKLFYPPKEYYTCLTGPPTLICSNIMDNNEFEKLIKMIEENINSYY